jgi:cobalt-zinc-cadmium efflux system protein
MAQHQPDGHGHDHDHADHEHAHGHERGHEHDHAHGGHGHHHGPVSADPGNAFLLAIVLNTVFVGVEFFYGVLANSTALMADAGHNLSDVLGLVFAWGAAVLALRRPQGRYTYGLRSSSILAALLNSLLLMLACGGIGWEAVRRLGHPDQVAGVTVSVVAGVGIVINGISAWLFARRGKEDINVRAAYLHMAADAAISLGVLVAGIVIHATGWLWVDPAVSVVIVGIILYSTWGVLRESVAMTMAAAPEGIEVDEVRSWLAAQSGVTALHDLHVWAMSTTETALTAHLVMPAGHPGNAVLDGLAGQLRSRFGIGHSTLQVEVGDANHDACPLHAAPRGDAAQTH